LDFSGRQKRPRGCDYCAVGIGGSFFYFFHAIYLSAQFGQTKRRSKHASRVFLRPVLCPADLVISGQFLLLFAAVGLPPR
jgi:hypothetical protein